MDSDDHVAREHRRTLLRHLWSTYQATIDGRTKRGDVEVLAEAAARNDWAGVDEIGDTIAELLIAGYRAEQKESPKWRMVRDREIVGLAKIHEEQGLTRTASFERIAHIYGMTPDAVTKVVKRKSKG